MQPMSDRNSKPVSLFQFAKKKRRILKQQSSLQYIKIIIYDLIITGFLDQPFPYIYIHIYVF